MDTYIEIIRPLKGETKIAAFAKAVENLNLINGDLEYFAWKCGFMLTENIKGNYDKKEKMLNSV